LVFAGSALAAVKPILSHVEPPFWWTGFKNPELQLMIHGENISQTKPEIAYPGVELVAVTAIENPNYLFIDLRLDENIKPGKFDILFKMNGKTVQSYTYELKEREKGSSDREGFNNTDAMYLIMPDRFANGDPSNDEIAGMPDILDRTEQYARHGGDIKGIRDHLDYIDEQGYTAIWVNPVLENDMPEASYHGYATTDFYKVDRRFGSNEDYRQLSIEAQKKGIKIVMDMIFNHCGTGHWWMKDMPMKDWLNDYPEYSITNHRKTIIQDPYVSKTDYKEMVDGWFVSAMPDINQRNPFVEKYLIQNSIWWIEYVGLAGIRMDTYPYPDMQMMSRWTCRLMEEYPNFNIVGEQWHTNPSLVSYWQRGKKNENGYVSCLPSLMEFPIQDAIIKAFTEKEGWSEGIMRLYETLALDFEYPEADNLVIFADNHDTERFYSSVGENYGKFKQAMAYLMTIRGIPQIYYGGEILMTGRKSEGDGMLRKDFPGGWTGDQQNGFNGTGISDQQKVAQQYLKKLVNWRKGKSVIHTGKVKHYYPKEGVYVYFRYNEKESVMIVLNNSSEDKSLKTDRFKESLNGWKTGHEVISGKDISDLSSIPIPAQSAMIIELK
jgi:glycosidase